MTVVCPSTYEFSGRFGRKLTTAENRAVANYLRCREKKIMEAERRQSCISSDYNIEICTAYSTDYTIGHTCASVNRAYADRQGYTFSATVLDYREMLAEIAPRQHCTWYKVLVILGYLRNYEYLTTERGIRYIMWIDADAIVISHDRRIQELVELGDYCDLIIAEDMHSGCLVNAGVMLIRMSKWSLELWEEIWASERSKKYFDVFYYEQSALIRCLKARGEGLEQVRPFHSYLPGGLLVKTFLHTCVLPHFEMNTNVGWVAEGKKKTSIIEGALIGTYLSSHSSIDDSYEDNTVAAAASPVRGVGQEPRFIFHAVGQWNKGDVLEGVIRKFGLVRAAALHSSVTDQNHPDTESESPKLMNFRLLRGKCGSIPAPELVEQMTALNIAGLSSTKDCGHTV